MLGIILKTVVEDDDLVRNLLVELLSDSYNCSVGSSAKQALETLNAQRFDLVVTDIDMPTMSGVELSRLINDNFPKTAVILMSGGYSKLTKSDYGPGVCGYIAKPFNNTEFFGIDCNCLVISSGHQRGQRMSRPDHQREGKMMLINSEERT